MTILAVHEPEVARATVDLCTQHALGSGCPMRARATVTISSNVPGSTTTHRQCGMHAVISVQATPAATIAWDDEADEPFAVSVAALSHAGADIALAEACDTRPRTDATGATVDGLVEKLRALGFELHGPHRSGCMFWVRKHLWVTLEFEDCDAEGATIPLPGGQITVQLDEQDPVLKIPAYLPWSLQATLDAIAAMTPLKQYQDTLALVAAHAADCPSCGYCPETGCTLYQRLATMLADVRLAFDATLTVAPEGARQVLGADEQRFLRAVQDDEVRVSPFDDGRIHWLSGGPGAPLDGLRFAEDELEKAIAAGWVRPEPHPYRGTFQLTSDGALALLRAEQRSAGGAR